MFQFIYICFLFITGFNLCLCFEETWQAYENDIRNANREELVVTNVTTDENFKVDGNISKWISLSIGNTCYSVGLMDTGVAVLYTVLKSVETKFEIKSTIKDLSKKPIDAILMHNKNSETIEAILIIAYEDELQLEWYKIHETELDSIWTWNLIHPVFHINEFSLNQKEILLLSSRYSENHTSVDLYQYEITDKNRPLYRFWQSLDVSHPAPSSAFNNFELDSYISLPQKSSDLVIVFKYDDNKFIPYKTITSINVEKVVSFEIGFQSFLAIDGLNAGIYEFKKDKLEREQVIGSNLNGIDYWLPVPVKTYRDDVLLLAQRTVQYSTHKANLLEIFTYNGAIFEEHEDIPCTHFGEQVEWLTCISDGSAITGFSYLLATDKLGLILPRRPNTPFLVMVNFDIKQMPDPLELELKKMLSDKERLQTLIDVENKAHNEFKVIYKTSGFIDNTPQALLSSKLSQRESVSPLNQQIEDIGKDIEEIKDRLNNITEKRSKNEFDVVTIDGPVVVEGKGKFKEILVEELKGEPATELLKDIVRKDSMKKIAGDKTFKILDVTHIAFDTVNGIEASEILFNENSLVTISGDLIVHSPTKIENVNVLTGQINDVDLVKQIVDVENDFNGTLHFENIKVQNEFQTEIINDKNLPTDKLDPNSNHTESDQQLIKQLELENLTVSNINGENFESFINQLCLVNIKCVIPGDIKINGDIIADAVPSITHLNDLKFPDEYVFKKSNSMPTTITGRKIFKNSLTGNEIRSQGKIDGISTKNLITLTTDQDISGTVRFKDIEVAEQLNVTGKILGEYIDKFLPNPTLQFVNNTKSNVNFKKLQVKGNIIIENYWDGKNFENTLKDLVYKDEKVADISAQKDFPKGFTVKKNLEIKSNSINNINLDSIVTKDTDQVLNITLLKGDVSIKNLDIGGKFDGEDIVQMDQDLVKLSGEQYISSTLIFKEELEAQNFEITETLNGVRPEEFLYTDGDREIVDATTFKEIEADNIVVEGNFIGEIADIDLGEYCKRYLSYSKDQIIEKHFDIVHSTIDNLETETVNGEDYDDVFSHGKFSEKMKERLRNGQLKVQDLYVNGSLQIDLVNGKTEKEWVPNNGLKDSNGKYKKELFIEGDIYFDTLDIDKLSTVNWTWFNQQLIRKHEVNTIIEAPFKNFLEGIRVAKLIETKKLNGIPVEDILRKQGKRTFTGPITIKGDVYFKEGVKVSDRINEVAVGEVLSNLVVEDSVYHIKGDMVFSRVPHIRNLNIEGYVNNKDIAEHLSHIVLLNEDVEFSEEIIFEAPVEISGNLAIQQSINGINFTEMADRIVLTTKDAEIQGTVIFYQPVVIIDHVKIDESLNTLALHGIDLEEWKTNAVFLDKGMVKGTYGFDEIIIENRLITKHLNAMDMNSIIPLKSSQIINYLEIGEVTTVGNIPVAGSVNKFSNLSEEFEHTVMTDTDQLIDSHIVFEDPVLVRETLFTHFINGKEASKIVTTNTDQDLTAEYNFKSQCKLNSDLHIYGLINDINMTAWLSKNMKIFSPTTQEVKHDWNVAADIIFNDGVAGNGLVNDLNLKSVMKEVNDRKDYKYKAENAIIKDYVNMCLDVSYMYEASKKQIYKLKYFEDLQTISFKNEIQLVHFFQSKNNHYILVNDNKCFSQLLIFQGDKFEHLSTVKTGHIAQVVTIRDDEKLRLVTRGVTMKKKCEVDGTNVWLLDDDILAIEYSIEDQDLLQESAIPNTFYGLNAEGVIEYKMNDIPRKYRKWKIFEENVAFVPRGLKMGLSLRTGQKIIYLDRSDPVVDEFNLDIEAIIIGNTSEVTNHIIPGRDGDDMVVTKVGIKSARKNLVAVATHEETSVKGRLDFVKIYSDVLKGKMFHKVPAYKPSSLLSIDFGQGETLLVFMENERTLQVYEYKGIEGFKHRSSAKVEGSSLFLMTLPIEPFFNPRKVIGIVHKNRISLIQSVMIGNQIKDNLKCGL